MGPKERFNRAIASQLARPHGPFGRLVAARLNRSNAGPIQAAVTLLAPSPGAVVADVGFGGGIGLQLLLDAVGPQGVVHGVDISETALALARRHYEAGLREGRVVLHNARMSALPFAAGTMGGAITINTIYFVGDLDAALRELARVLAPGGKVVIGLADPAAMAAMPVVAHGFEVRPVDDVLAALTRVRLRLASHERVGTDDDSYHLLLAERPALAAG